jgi:predicted CopG family antitoxin
MATKTISIDVEAYGRLKSVQKANESFSQTIKRVIYKPADFQKWLKQIEDDPASPEFIEAVEEQIAARRKRASRKR